MFDSNDYSEYFQELYRIEVEMEEFARELKELFDNPEIISLLDHMAKDELRHARIVSELADKFKSSVKK